MLKGPGQNLGFIWTSESIVQWLVPYPEALQYQKNVAPMDASTAWMQPAPRVKQVAVVRTARIVHLLFRGVLGMDCSFRS